MGRSRKQGRKFCSSHHWKKVLSLYQAKLLEEINKHRNITKKAEADPFQKQEEMNIVKHSHSKGKLLNAIVMIIVALIVSFFVSPTSVAAESLSVLGNVPLSVAIGSILPAVAITSSPTIESNDESRQAWKKIVPTSGEIFRERPKISIDAQLILYQKLSKNRDKSSKEILSNICEIKIELSISQVNRIRKEWGLNRKKGRPRKEGRFRQGEQGKIISTIQAKAGIKLFAIWLDENGEHERAFNSIHLAIEVYKQACVGEDFRLLHSILDTINKKWKALSLLSLLGIERLSQLDYHEHNLSSILGYDYSYSTLTQFLSELERIDAGYFLNIALACDAKGEYCYLDGHKIAYWTRKKMHKGRITGNGRIMAGSTLIIAHDQFARAIHLELHPADTHLTHVIEDYCTDIVELTGISIFIIDREVNSPRMAQLFIDKGWQLLCLLSANEYKGIESFTPYFSTKLEDGTRLYKAKWKEHREDDPRAFVIIVEGDKIIVYWGTPNLIDSLTAEQLVKLYRSRTEIQENSIKDMISHGALDVNYGRKTFFAPDRTHQRKIDKIDEKIEKRQAKLEKTRQDIVEQDRKVTQSILRGHQALLETRRNKLAEYRKKEQEIKKQIAEVEKKKEELGAPGQRQDRDLRKQLIMASRTARLENQLKSFGALISRNLDEPVDIETILALFFRRSAVEVETHDMILYRFNTKGLSPKFQIILKNIIDGFNRISLSHKGKKVLVEIVGFL